MKMYRTFCSYFVLSNLVGCSLTGTQLHGDRPYIESTTTHTRPVSEPVRAMTSFSDSLSCMDNLLRQSNVGQTIVAIKTINDPSGKALVSANDMIVTSLSQMSRTSGAFRVVDFEINPLKQDTVQTLTSLLLPTGHLQIPAPQIYISGSVSYVDQNVLKKSNSAGVSVSDDAEVGVSGDLLTTALGMELHIGDFLSRTLYPGIDSANEIVAANKGFGFDSGAKIEKVGIQFSFERNLSQGVGSAVRTLSDLGMIELVGKFSQVPYWQCLSLDQSHPEFQRQLLDWYEGMGEAERLKFFQTGLRNLGYFTGNADGKNSIKFREALTLFQKDNNATPSGFINFESYERMMKNYTRVDATGNFKKVGLEPSSGGKDDGLNEPRNGYPYFYSDKGAPIALNLSSGKSKYSLGEKLVFDVGVDKEGTHVSCFYQDVASHVAQIYPNPLQQEVKVSSSTPLQLPQSGTFSLDLNQPGQESVMCVATYSSLDSRLRQAFGEPFNPINVKNMTELSAKLKALFGNEIKGEKTITYTIN
ncbi:MAG TPA: peptidoglycan-binding protein [Pasteurellaceae bacterium]|nr:peptidoglycan-binding protein [Pasteurellaceae bacterium]